MNLTKLALYYGSQKNNLSFSILRSGEREHMLKEPSGKSLRLYARRLSHEQPTRHRSSAHGTYPDSSAQLQRTLAGKSGSRDPDGRSIAFKYTRPPP
jgi:hypothetical protein